MKDAFVTQFVPNGQSLIYSTYLGGEGWDIGHGIAVDSAYQAYVTGETDSQYFPLANAFSGTYNGGLSDVFATVYNATGSSLLYSDYLGVATGGSVSESGYSITVGSVGNA